MAIVPEAKKTSIVVSILDLLLAAAVCYLFYAGQYMSKGSAFDFQGIFKYIISTYRSYNYTYVTSWQEILGYGLPVVIGILALFGRLGRFINVLMVCSAGYTTATIFIQRVNEVSQGTAKFLDFGNTYEPMYACAFICAIVLLILSFVNAEKSK